MLKKNKTYIRLKLPHACTTTTYHGPIYKRYGTDTLSSSCSMRIGYFILFFLKLTYMDWMVLVSYGGIFLYGIFSILAVFNIYIIIYVRTCSIFSFFFHSGIIFMFYIICASFLLYIILFILFYFKSFHIIRSQISPK